MVKVRSYICMLFCSKQIEFGLQTPQEIVKCGVFHVYERNLYKASVVADCHSCQSLVSYPLSPLPFERELSINDMCESYRPLCIVLCNILQAQDTRMKLIGWFMAPDVSSAATRSSTGTMRIA
eukprot:1158486-Pelagomonas_calceolata.AAC.3